MLGIYAAISVFMAIDPAFSGASFFAPFFVPNTLCHWANNNPHSKLSKHVCLSRKTLENLQGNGRTIIEKLNRSHQK